MDSKLWNLEYGIYGIDLKNGIWNMEWPKSWNLWNFFIMSNIQGSQVLHSKAGQIRAI
jgi:hypothetical protein